MMIDSGTPVVSADTKRQMTDKTREIYGLLRKLRQAAGLSLRQAADKFMIADVVIGSYERGDRHPTVDRLNDLLGHYGYEVAAVPTGSVIIPPTGPDMPPRVWTEQDIADTLRSISGHYDQVLGHDSRNSRGSWDGRR